MIIFYIELEICIATENLLMLVTWICYLVPHQMISSYQHYHSTVVHTLYYLAQEPVI